MRILITQKGSQVIKELEETTCTSRSPQGSKPIHKKRRRLTVTHFHPYQTNSSLDSFNETSSRMKTLNPFLKTSQTIESNSNDNIKTVKLSMSKINFPKQFIGKYEDGVGGNKPIISNVSRFLPTISSQDDSKLYSFKEIIPSKNLVTLKRNFINDTRRKEMNTRINETNFRTPYELQTPMEKLNEMLTYPKINANRSNLIKYLNESEMLNPVSLKTIVESDGEKIGRVNKMCQMLSHRDDQQRLVKEIIQNKLKEKIASDKITFHNHIHVMKEEIEDINGYLEKYRKRIKDREKYRDLYNEMNIHHWKKYDLSRFDKGQKRDSHGRLIKISSTISNMNDEGLFKDPI